MNNLILITLSIILLVSVIAVSVKSISMGINSRRNINNDKNEDLEDEDGELNNNIDNKFDDKKSISDEIIKLKKLYNDGFITEEEFKKAKNKILS